VHHRSATDPEQRLWDELVERGRALVANVTHSKFKLGDLALEIAPVGQQGVVLAQHEKDRLGEFADAVGIERHTLDSYRHVAFLWPESTRVQSVSWSVHRRFAHEGDRAELIRSRARWTHREADELVRERVASRLAATQSQSWAAGRSVTPHVVLPPVVRLGVDRADEVPESEPLAPEDFNHLEAALRKLAFRLTQRPYPMWGPDGLRLALERLGAVSSSLIQVEAELSSALAEVEGES
jgi:hypothetical protein